MEVKRETAPCDKDSQLKNQMNLKPVNRETIWFVDKMGIHAAGYVFTCSVYLYHSISRLSSLARIHLNPNESSWFTLICLICLWFSGVKAMTKVEDASLSGVPALGVAMPDDHARGVDHEIDGMKSAQQTSVNLGCFKFASNLFHVSANMQLLSHVACAQCCLSWEVPSHPLQLTKIFSWARCGILCLQCFGQEIPGSLWRATEQHWGVEQHLVKLTAWLNN